MTASLSILAFWGGKNGAEFDTMSYFGRGFLGFRPVLQTDFRHGEFAALLTQRGFQI